MLLMLVGCSSVDRGTIERSIRYVNVDATVGESCGESCFYYETQPIYWANYPVPVIAESSIDVSKLEQAASAWQGAIVVLGSLDGYVDYPHGFIVARPGPKSRTHIRFGAAGCIKRAEIELAYDAGPKTMMHELGHALGLDHDRAAGGIMDPDGGDGWPTIGDIQLAQRMASNKVHCSRKLVRLHSTGAITSE